MTAQRWIWFGLGWAFLAIGIVGVVVPLLPTTPLLLLAVWAFSRSSQRFHDWIVEHRVLGPPVQRWRRERILPLRVKAIAVGSMLASMGYITFALHPPWYVLAAMGGVVAVTVTFLARIPSRPIRAP